MLTDALHKALPFSYIAEDRIFEVSNCKPDETAFSFLSEKDLTDSVFEEELQSAMT